jgi:hypothetical protein
MKIRYAYGYMPKIDYYSSLIESTARSLATSPTVESKVQLLMLLEEYSGKLNYFINKEHIRLNQL